MTEQVRVRNTFRKMLSVVLWPEPRVTGRFAAALIMFVASMFWGAADTAFAQSTTNPRTDREEKSSSWDGTWETSAGKIVLVVGPDKTIRGSSDWNGGGRQIGTVDGPRAVGYWSQPEATYDSQRCGTVRDGSYYWGRFVLKANSDWSAFESLWSYCDKEPSNSWTAKRSSGGKTPMALPPKVSELRFVRQVDQRFEPVKDDLKYGEPFFVEARFEAELSEAPKTVRLEWGTGQSQEIAVKRTSDAKIFRSERLYLEPPASAEEPARR